MPDLVSKYILKLHPLRDHEFNVQMDKTNVVMLDSVLQGEDLHARLTNPRGVVIKSSVLLEKTKLEEEVKQLQLKITELER